MTWIIGHLLTGHRPSRQHDGKMIRQEFYALSVASLPWSGPEVGKLVVQPIFSTFAHPSFQVRCNIILWNWRLRILVAHIMTVTYHGATTESRPSTPFMTGSFSLNDQQFAFPQDAIKC